MTYLQKIFALLLLGLTIVVAQQYNSNYGQDPYSQGQNNSRYNSQNQYDGNRQYNQQDQYGMNRQNSQQGENDYNRQHNPQGQYDNNRQYNPQGQNDNNRQYNPQGQNDNNRQYNPQGQNDNNRQYNPQGQNDNNRQYHPPGQNENRQYNSQGQYDDNRQFQHPGQYDTTTRNPYNNQGQYDNRQGMNNNNREYKPIGGQYDNRPTNQNDRSQSSWQSNSGQQSSSRFGDGNCCDEYCYATDSTPYLKFATKTAYHFVYGKTSNQHIVPGCRPIQFWSLNRHGTRLPGRESIRRLQYLSKIHDEIIRNYEERRSFPEKGRLCEEDFDLLKNWRWNETVNDHTANSLTSQGVDDLKYLARRYKTRYGELLSRQYNPQYYYFRHTDTKRTHDSYKAYVEGIFEQNAYSVHADVQNNDTLIGTYKSCAAWEDQVERNPITHMEVQKLMEKQEYKELVRNVYKRLGFRFVVNETVIDDMYDMCRYEKAWNINKLSPWCAAFTREQLKLLEYAEDLKHYYNHGYGSEINKLVGCPLVKDLFERFDRTVNGDNSGEKVVAYFTHTAMLQTFLVAMGIAKDDVPLLADNYYTQARRQWSTSKISPFAGNLAAVLYECEQEERHRVMFFLNEVPVEYSECSVGLCSWNTVKQKLQNSVSCNLDFCYGKSSTLSHFNFIGTLLFALIPLIYDIY